MSQVDKQMSKGSPGVFQCPSCEGVAVGQGDGTALCGGCNFRFALPKEAQESAEAAESSGKPPAKSAAKAPGSATLPVAAVGLVERNINLRAVAGFEKSGDGAKPKGEPQEPLAARSYEEVAVTHRPNRQKKKRPIKKKRNYLKIISLWLLTVTVVGGIALWVNEVTSERAKAIQPVVDNLSGDKRAFFLKEYPGIGRQMQGFIQATSSEERESFVLQTPKVSRRMASYYRENAPSLPPSLTLPSPTFWNVAFNESPGFVEVGWDFGFGKGVEALFVKVNDQWRLDWEHYIRWNTENWALFRQNLSDDSEGTFRLFVEKIDEGENSENPWTKIRFYEPLSDETKRAASVSPIIKIEGDNEFSTAILETFVDRSVESEGFSRLWQRDPIHLRRMTVQLAWETDSETSQEMLVVKGILAQHWRTLEVGE